MGFVRGSCQKLILQMIVSSAQNEMLLNSEVTQWTLQGQTMLSRNTCILSLTLLTLLLGSRVADCQPKTMTPLSIIEKMATQYATASSYQDSGVVIDVNGDTFGQDSPALIFKTYFERPHFFRTEWIERDNAQSREPWSVVWNDGKQTWRYYSWDPTVKKETNIGLGIAGATGISRGSAHTVLALLLEAVGGFRLTETTNLSIIREEKFEGENCYVLRGYHPLNFPIDMWISKNDFLLRKTEKRTHNGAYQVEIRRNVKLNGKIPPDIFNFTPPAPKQKSSPNTVLSLTRRVAKLTKAIEQFPQSAQTFQTVGNYFEVHSDCSLVLSIFRNSGRY